ncbi:MAG TPA: flagellin hook IN motif-containing protein [Tepidisphaeraceae bacterium]|jgi:flagellar hook-associated protein 3
MAVLPVNIARVSNQLRTGVALSQLQNTQGRMLRVQNELVTGRKLNTPSDNPADANLAQQIRKTLEQRAAYAQNLTSSKNTLSSVDTTLGDITGLLQQGQTLASANVGDDVTQDSRDAAAAQIESIYAQLTDLGNKSFEGSYLFAGGKLDKPPFEQFAGGMRFVGSEITLKNQVDEATDASFQVNGAEVWGALSTRIESANPLTPIADGATRLADLGGAQGKGVQRGMIAIGNGTTTTKIDLTNADTISDVVSAINNAALGSVTAALNATGDGITVSGGAGETLSVDDLGGVTTAADLGVKTASPMAAGAPVVGTSTNPKLTPLTPLSSLNGGAGMDTSGLKITNGGKSATIDLSAANTVQDLINAVNGSDTGVRMDVNADGTGLRLLNTTQGTTLSVAENAGTTAADLGLRSFNPDSKLAELNSGSGVRTIAGVDFNITDSAGTAFDVDLTDSTQTPQDVIDAINTAAGGAGAGVTASFATDGNGIVLTDTAGGGATMKLVAVNYSDAAADLGLNDPAVAGVITGRDVNPVVAQGVFANVSALSTALRKGDQAAITKAAEALQGDYDRIVRNRGEVGARLQAVESRTDRMDEQNVATKALLSQLEDTDFTEAATRYSLLQTSLQASMQTTSTMLSLSLMDFIR